MSGTIRCCHYKAMAVVSTNDESAQLKSECCELDLLLDILNSIMNGGNFTHVFLKDKEELDQYKKDNAERFHFVSSAVGPLDDGRYHIVF